MHDANMKNVKLSKWLYCALFNVEPLTYRPPPPEYLNPQISPAPTVLFMRIVIFAKQLFREIPITD